MALVDDWKGERERREGGTTCCKCSARPLFCFIRGVYWEMCARAPGFEQDPVVSVGVGWRLFFIQGWVCGRVRKGGRGRLESGRRRVAGPTASGRAVRPYRRRRPKQREAGSCFSTINEDRARARDN